MPDPVDSDRGRFATAVAPPPEIIRVCLPWEEIGERFGNGKARAHACSYRLGPISEIVPIRVTVTISRKVVSADELNREDAAAFREFFRADRAEHTDVQHNAPKMLPKAGKELGDFCRFARSDCFKATIKELCGIEPENTLELEILSAEGEDPPDIVLKVGSYALGIEVTDFPPDRAAFAKAMTEVEGPAPLPAFHEGACSPDVIKRFMTTPMSLVKPHHSSYELDVVALYDCARDALGKKGLSEKSELLLLAGPFASAWPTNEVIAAAIAATEFRSIKAVVLVLTNESLVHWTKGRGGDVIKKPARSP